MSFFASAILLDIVASIAALALIGAFAAPTLVMARRRARAR